MSAVGICAIAFSSTGERYDSYHEPPEVTEYIESAESTGFHGYVDHGKFYQVDTNGTPCGATAAPEVSLPSGEHRPFSYWLIKRNPYELSPTLVPDRRLPLREGDALIIGLCFGAQRPPIIWPGFDIKAFDRFIHIMQSHAPSWDYPHPEPWIRKEPIK